MSILSHRNLEHARCALSMRDVPVWVPSIVTARTFNQAWWRLQCGYENDSIMRLRISYHMRDTYVLDSPTWAMILWAHTWLQPYDGAFIDWLTPLSEEEMNTAIGYLAAGPKVQQQAALEALGL